MYTIRKYTALEYYNLYYHSDDSYETKSLGIGIPVIAKNCVAVFPENNSDGCNMLPSRKIKNTLDNYEAQAPQKIFIHPECSIRRDLYRNSKFNIKIDPDKANKYIIPDPYSYKVFEDIELAVYEKDTGILRLYQINHNKKGRSYHKDIYEYDLEKLREEFQSESCEVFTVKYHEDGREDYSFPVEIFKDLPCWWDILENSFETKYDYVLESNVEIFASVKISPETLIMWKNMEEENMETSICNSDWWDYPYTLWTFLKTYYNSYSINKMFKFIQRIIGSDKFKGETITPKDWNMLQDFICTLANGTTQMGYATSEINKKLLERIPHRMMIKPLKIDTEMTTKELINKLQNA